MARIEKFRRIAKEDFPEEMQAIADKIGSPINQAMDQIVNAINGNLTVADNLKQSIVTLDVKVDASGNPTTPAQFKNSIVSRVEGLQVISAFVSSNLGTYTTGTPFINFTQKDQLVTIKNITNLTASTTWTIKFIVIFG